MKIGFDAKRAFHNARGLGNYSRDLVRLLAHYYPENSYSLFNPSDKRTLWCPPEGVYEQRPTRWLDRQLPALWRSTFLCRDIKSLGLDLYHGLSQELPWGIHRLPVRRLVTLHDAIFIRHPELYSSSYVSLFTHKNRYACKVADHLIAISEQTKRDFISFFDLPEEKISVVYQGCHNRFRSPVTAEEQAVISRRYALPANYLLTVGAIEKRKNLELILRAMSSAKSDLPLVVVGSPTRYMEEIIPLINRLGLRARLHFLHDVSSEDLPAIYRMASIFLYPSFFEGFGIPILEALCVGVPVIAATGSCLEETGGRHSLYVDPADPAALADAMDRVLSDRALSDRMVTEGRRYAERFKDEQVVKRLMEVYLSC